MTTVPGPLALVASLMRAGRGREAEEACRQVLAAQPGLKEAWNYLGVLVHQAGRSAEARECFQRAAAIDPQYAEAQNNLGNVLRLGGELERAAACYEQALRSRPGMAEAHYNLGFVRHEARRWEEAIAHYRRALEISPQSAYVYGNLGRALADSGELDAAIDCYRRLIELTPNSDMAHFALAMALFESGAIVDSIQSFKRALTLNPNHADSYNGLGVAFKAVGQLEGAIGCFQRAIRSKPDFVAAINNLGLALQAQDNYAQAVDCHRRALEINPASPEVNNNLGMALKQLRKLDEAGACYRRALDIKPDYAEARSNLGTVLKDQWKLEEAVDCYRRALAAQPGRAELHTNLGLALQERRRLDEARLCFEQAIELDPGQPEAHFALAVLALLEGDYAKGWAEYEWRWRRDGARRRSLAGEEWDGGSLAGKTILLHAEQGLGDTIQFARLVPLIKARASRVLLECQEPLLPLLGDLNADRLLKRGEELPPFDVHSPLLSLPRWLELAGENIPAVVPYLNVDCGLVERAQEALRPVNGFKIGIAWQGNPTFSGDLRRSIPLRHYEALTQAPGVRLVSLQKGAGVEQISGIEEKFEIVMLDGEWSEGNRSLTQTAAMMRAVDLVVTSDTSIAHLAGALGVPVWVALSYMPDWRWQLDRADSPWYPTMRLFRQPTPGDWDGVFREMSRTLGDQMQGGERG